MTGSMLTIVDGQTRVLALNSGRRAENLTESEAASVGSQLNIKRASLSPNPTEIAWLEAYLAAPNLDTEDLPLVAVSDPSNLPVSFGAGPALESLIGIYDRPVVVATPIPLQAEDNEQPSVLLPVNDPFKLKL